MSDWSVYEEKKIKCTYRYRMYRLNATWMKKKLYRYRMYRLNGTLMKKVCTYIVCTGWMVH